MPSRSLWRNCNVDPAHIGLYLIDSLKDDQVIKMINKSIDYDLITDKVSIAMINHFKVYEDKLWVKDKVIADLRMRKKQLSISLHRIGAAYVKKHFENWRGGRKPDEDPFQTVLGLCGGMKLDPPLQIKDIDNCHCVGRKQLADGRPWAIIVKLSS